MGVRGFQMFVECDSMEFSIFLESARGMDTLTFSCLILLYPSDYFHFYLN